MSPLFAPLALQSLELSNRIVIAPMCQYSAEDGCATDWHLIHLGQLAISGAGMLILEATAVSPEGRITHADLGLYCETTMMALGRVLDGVRKYSDTPLAIQLGHAGRKASSRAPWDGGSLIPPAKGGWQPVAPSAVPHSPGESPPVGLDADSLARIRADFASAAQRAVSLGLQAIELHMAHGYLLHQFLSPLANKRADCYGGSLENRMRFPLEVLDAVSEAVSAKVPVGVRISGTDWAEGGLNINESVQFGRVLEQRGVAWIHVSSGGVSPKQSIPVAPGYQVPLATQVRKAVDIPVIAVGLITDPGHAERIVASGQADLVALARGVLYNPRWPWHAAAHLGGQVRAPRQYWRCQPEGQKELFGRTYTGQR
ncbi:MAG: NADH:flavin oxidoreductase/NADH oxidase [Ectothiorhodospiraceae bacterium]|nr:NADH:flavin oxidoreductase/NADH oxidase [Ectothiorhodospiraceae bacterium]